MINNLDNNEFTIIKKLFQTTIGEHIDKDSKNTTYPKEMKLFLTQLDDFCSLTLGRHSEQLRQLYYLYLLGILFLDYNNKFLDFNHEEFTDNILSPNMITAMTILENAGKTIMKYSRKIYKEIYESSKEVIDFYLVFYSTESIVIQTDIILKFIKSSFLNEDPLNIDNLNIYYSSKFRDILYSYLQNRTSNLMSFELDPSILEDDYIMNISTRYKIYERGLTISHTQQLCKGSETMKLISDNYDKIRTSILSDKTKKIGVNFLQKKYHDVVDDSRVRDNKLLILKSSTESYNLNKISKKLPLIYKLLRSVYIESQDSVFLESDKKLIYDTIYEVVFNKFKERLDDFELKLVTQEISTGLTTSLVNGSFVDPYTMDSVNITGYLFARQLKTFLNILLKDAEL